MKLKNLIISASVAAAGSGLLATVLTSCAQAHIDDDLKIELNDQGLFTNDVGFAAVVKNALTRSDSWSTFKQALADEIVFKWYEDRASADKGDTTKNVTFRTNLDEWKYEIDKDYNSVVDTCKSKYGANWQWYLQNEYLSAYGGTEDNYKHAKLVEKVKNDFITNAFAYDYFGYVKNTVATDYPHILTDVTLSPTRNDLNNPANWTKLGFFARTNRAYPVTDLSDLNQLAKYPDGDYAILQDYVFNRWFRTEKPFFSAAALFKYSLPNQTTDKKLTDIYSNKYVTIPDAPNEAFPFFGGVSVSQNGSTGVKACFEWYQALLNNEFSANGAYTVEGVKHYNGTTSIPTNYTEDSQTLLLCYGKDMMAGESNSLYVPYAIATADLYEEMIEGWTRAQILANAYNVVAQSVVSQNILINPTAPVRPQGEDDFRILSNFMYKGEYSGAGTSASPYVLGVPQKEGSYWIDSFIDLNNIYGGLKEEQTIGTVTADVYTCPLFKNNADYLYFTGDKSATTKEEVTGVRYVTNRIQTLLHATTTGAPAEQPWMFELNEAGMHAQTIDGYNFVNTASDHEEALKQVLMYRLMQQKQDYDGGMISASVLGSDGALKTYFNDNFANIVLEMALSDAEEVNIFRNIDTYEEETTTDTDKLFFDVICSEQSLGTASLIATYIDATDECDFQKKWLDTIASANNRIYQYRKTQIENSRGVVDNKRYENGLLAPIPTTVYNNNLVSQYHTTRVYHPVINMLGDVTYLTYSNAVDAVAVAVSNMFVTEPTVDGTSGFSLMVADAKKAQSNRAWFKSTIVDKFMYQFMGTGGLANAIKMGTYESYYTDKAFASSQYKWANITSEYENAKTTTYRAPKILASDNLANYFTSSTGTNFFNIVNSGFTNWMGEKTLFGGAYSAEALDQDLFEATVAYLAADDFKNFYTSINKQIGDDEAAMIGYVVKYDEYEDQDATKWVSLYGANPALSANLSTAGNSVFEWNINVDNIFDTLLYQGETEDGRAIGKVQNTKVTSDFYNNVISRNVAGVPHVLGGFTGIQTAGSNQLDADSGLKDAVFSKLGQCIENNVAAQGEIHGQNDGVLFPWAGATSDGETPYTFEAIADPRPTPGETITPESFTGASLTDALKLAKKIAECSTIDDLKTLATSLGNAIDGHDIFDEIGSGAYTPKTTDPNQIVNEVKYVMLDEFVSNASTYKPYFTRLTDAQVHATDDKGGNTKYCFDAGDRYGYKVMFTQLNKSDIIEKRLAPKWTGTTWDYSKMPIASEEFWFLLTKLAADASTQQLAITEAIKQVHGDNKLTVYDAQLYNQFDSTWIKDWTKKPIGGEGA